MYKNIVFVFLFITSFLGAQNLEKVSLQFHWLDQFEFAGYYIAKEKGFYKDAGLDVKFKNYKYGMDVTKEIANKNATYGIGGSDLIVDISNGADISLMAAIFQSSPLVLLTTENSGIKSLKDFKNKSVMLTPDTRRSVTYNAMLNKENISFDDMQVMEHSFNVYDLIEAKVDIFQSYITNEPFSLKQAGVKPVIFDPKDYGFDFYSDILFTSNDEIKNNRQRVIAFKNASLKGWKYAFENIEESVDIIYKKYNSQNRSREALLFEALESKKLAYDNNIPLGNISTNKIERMYDAYNIMNLIKNRIDIKRYLFINEENKNLSLSAKEVEFLKNNPVLVISNEIDYPPYDFFEEEKPQGYSIDLIRLLADKLNVKIRFETGTWENLVKKFCKGEIDILHPSDKSEDVKNCARFTSAIIQDTSQFLLRSNFKQVSTIKDLYGYKVASPKGWQQTEHFKANYKDVLEVIEVNNTLEAMKKVRNGEADFAYDYGNVLKYLKTKHNFHGLKIEGVYAKNSDFDNLYLAVHKNTETLKDVFQKALDSIHVSELEALQKKWFGKKLTTNATVSLTQKEKKFIQEHPSIKLGYSFLSQPVVMKDKKSSNAKGFAVDLAAIIKDQTGLHVEFVEGVWKEIVEKAQNKEIDGLAVSVFKNDTRKKYFDFTSAYMTQTPIVFVKKGNPHDITNPVSLQGKKMAILRGVEAMEALANEFGAQKIYYDNIREVIDSVISGKSDFSIFFENIFFIANTLGLNYIELGFAISKPLDAFFSIRKDYPEAISIINKAMNTIAPYELISSKNMWFDNLKASSKISFSKEQTDYINKKKSIKLCIHPKLMPYERFNDDGVHEGMTADIFKLLKNNSGINFEVIRTKSWSESLEFVKEKKCDMLSLAMKTKQREEYLDFTQPYISSPFVILTKSDKMFIDKIEDIIDEKIAIDKDYATVKLLQKQYPRLKIKMVDDIQEGIELVQKSEVYGYINTLPVLAYYLQKNSLVDVKINGKFDIKADLSIATRKDEVTLLSIMHSLLDTVNESTKQQIYNKWISVSYDKSIDYSLVWKIVVFALIISFLLLYRMKALKDNELRLQLLIEEELEKSRKKDNLLFQQHKMASLGNMIQTIAHQWRQPLSQLSMSQNLILRQIQTNNLSNENLTELLKEDQKVVQFMSNTINTFQNFYKDDFKEEIFSLYDAYKDVKYILSESINLNTIDIVENIDETIHVKGSKNYIAQIFLSILQNSVYFLKNRKIQAPKIYVKIEKIDTSIKIDIHNNDTGIDEEIIQKIFDYSFSRRNDEEKSTGLGLYIVKILVEEKFQGKIEAKNTKEGARFVISLPHIL